jgi:hypothetical protein
MGGGARVESRTFTKTKNEDLTPRAWKRSTENSEKKSKEAEKGREEKRREEKRREEKRISEVCRNGPPFAKTQAPRVSHPQVFMRRRPQKRRGELFG